MFFKHLHLSHLGVVALITLAFVKIYQHNLIIKLKYEKQRLEKKATQLRKDRNELVAVYAQLQDSQSVITKATNELGMKPLSIKQVRFLPSHADIPFLKTASTADVLQKLGLQDLFLTHTGGSHDSTRL